MEETSQAEYERATRDYWNNVAPDHDEISISVRRNGKLLRFVLIEREGVTTLVPTGDSSEPVA